MTSFLVEESDPYCLTAGQAAELLASAPWRRFAVIGDSLAVGTGDPSPDYASVPWADRVADALRRVHPDLAYLNLGKYAATTAKTLATQTDRLAEFMPDLVYICCGANDIWQPTPDFAEIETTLRQLFDRASDTGAQLATVALGRIFVVPTFPDFADRVHALNNVLRRVAADYRAALADMWDHPIMERSNLLSADKIHFSMSGHAVMAAEVVHALAGTLRRVG